MRFNIKSAFISRGLEQNERDTLRTSSCRFSLRRPPHLDCRIIFDNRSTMREPTQLGKNRSTDSLCSIDCGRITGNPEVSGSRVETSVLPTIRELTLNSVNTSAKAQ